MSTFSIEDKLIREGGIGASAFFISLAFNALSGYLAKPMSDREAKLFGQCITKRLIEAKKNNEDPSIEYALGYCNVEVKELLGQEWNLTKLFAVIGGVSGVFVGAPMGVIYYGFDSAFLDLKNPETKRKSIVFTVVFSILMWLTNIFLTSTGKFSTKKEYFIFALVFAFMASATSAYLHEFY